MNSQQTLFRRYSDFYEANWEKQWNRHRSGEYPFIEKVIRDRRAQEGYGLYMGYFCTMSLDLFDKDIDFDRVLNVNNLWLAIKLLDEMVDNGNSEDPAGFLDAVYESLYREVGFESPTEAQVSRIFREVMGNLEYSKNPSLCESACNLKESVKRGLKSRDFRDFLEADAEAGLYAGEVTGYGLVPSAGRDSDFMEYMRRISTAVNILDDIKNYRDDRKNLRLDGGGPGCLLKAGFLFSRNLLSSVMKLPKGKKTKFFRMTLPHSRKVFD
jgi:hypothetical protein